MKLAGEITWEISKLIGLFFLEVLFFLADAIKEIIWFSVRVFGALIFGLLVAVTVMLMFYGIYWIVSSVF